MHDCLIIGAGQFGIACAHKLKRAGVDALLVDADARVGETWRRRPRGLRLFTPRRYSSICGIAMSGDADGNPSGVEYGDYLASVVERLGMDVALSTRVERLERDAAGASNGAFVAHLADGRSVRARTVIDAAGANQAQKIPTFASRLDSSVKQIAAGAYRDPNDFGAEQTVCIVGDGASGRQIALELIEAGRRVVLARGRIRKMMPNRLLGRSLFWWLDLTGVAYADRESAIGRILRKRDPIPVANCRDAILAARGVRLTARATDAEGRAVVFADGERVEVDAVLWCGGYQERMDWLALPGIRSPQDLYADYGRTPEPGFFVVGRRWLSCRASELVLGVERDTERVVGAVRTYLNTPAIAAASETAVP